MSMIPILAGRGRPGGTTGTVQFMICSMGWDGYRLYTDSSTVRMGTCVSEIQNHEVEKDSPGGGAHSSSSSVPGASINPPQSRIHGRVGQRIVLGCLGCPSLAVAAAATRGQDRRPGLRPMGEGRWRPAQASPLRLPPYLR
jgi:hypothetical protein